MAVSLFMALTACADEPPGTVQPAAETQQEDLIPTVVGLDKAVAGWESGALSYPQPVLKTLRFQNQNCRPITQRNSEVSCPVALEKSAVSPNCFAQFNPT